MVDIGRDPVILMYSIQLMLGFGVWFCVGVALILFHHWRKR